jgi:branched-chain amino acid transport system permease protein
MYFAIFTFGLSELFRHALIWYEVNITRTVGRWLPLETPVTVYYYMLIILAITLLTAYLIGRSKYGLALQSIGQNEEASAHIGINVNMVKIIAFAVTCFFMGATGAVIATRWSYVDPSVAFAPFRSFYIIIMVILGGMQSTIYGPMLGATIVTLLSDVILVDFSRHTMLLFGIILIVVILFLPNGLIGILQRKRRGEEVTALRG